MPGLCEVTGGSDFSARSARAAAAAEHGRQPKPVQGVRGLGLLRAREAASGQCKECGGSGICEHGRRRRAAQGVRGPHVDRVVAPARGGGDRRVVGGEASGSCTRDTASTGAPASAPSASASLSRRGLTLTC